MVLMGLVGAQMFLNRRRTKTGGEKKCKQLLIHRPAFHQRRQQSLPTKIKAEADARAIYVTQKCGINPVQQRLLEQSRARDLR